MGEIDVYKMIQSPENVTFASQAGGSGSVKEMR